MHRNQTARGVFRAAAVIIGAVSILAGAASSHAWVIVPAYSSRPGATYTMYLNFGGFSFSGTWGNGSSTPGVTPAYNRDGNATAFSLTELANIQNMWSRVAEKYSPFDVNVTTLDPAVAAAQAGTDTLRQYYYDATPRLMHTVIGGSGPWSGGGGVSYVGVAANTYSSGKGFHTNWVFSAQAPNDLQFIAEASAHEDGHGFGLWHQSDYVGTTLVKEYSKGTGSGVGSAAPIMGNSYNAERGVWKYGNAHVNDSFPTIQNDPYLLGWTSGAGGFIEDGIGHSLATATPLPLSTGLAIDSAVAAGVIVPNSGSSPNPTGTANYVSDYWSFTTGSGAVSFNLHSGRQSITAGVADPGGMFDGVLRILDQSGTPVAGGTANGTSPSSLYESVTLSLAAGTYYAQVQSAGDPNLLGFYDMGSYFLSGSIVAVPEPSTLALLAMALVALVLGVSRRRVTR